MSTPISLRSFLEKYLKRLLATASICVIECEDEKYIIKPTDLDIILTDELNG